MKYPDKSKVHIYLCDDGAREEIRFLAEEMGIHYLARPDKKHAKAGNYNYALSHSSSPLVATFDADMIPMNDFLMELVPYFFLADYKKAGDGTWKRRKAGEQGAKIGFVQSPQSFYNLDLFQYNLYLEKQVPNEQDFFFQQVQLARNTNNSAIYGGSNTILSRQALLDAGGFYTDSITEDLATGLLIQSKGYQTWAVGHVHANGLSPMDIDSLLKQRDRWLRGCIQTIKQLKIIRRRDLSLAQKKDYLFCALYWYTPIRRCIFILAPILYTVFSIPLLHADVEKVTMLGILPLVLFHLLAIKGSGKIRPVRLSGIYDTILFPKLMISVILETAGITRKKFSVTAKEKKADHPKKNWRYILPHITLLLLHFVGIARCISDLLQRKSLESSMVLIWLLINSYFIIMALFFTLGRPVYREHERFAIKEQLVILAGENPIYAETKDLSEGGASFELDESIPILKEEKLLVQIKDRNKKYEAKGHARVVRKDKIEDRWRYAIEFTNFDRGNKLELGAIIHDRIPPLPKQVKGSDVILDLWRNISKRIR